MNLEGKTAVVTGGSRGIGFAAALELAKSGAEVAIVYAGNDAAANAACEEISCISTCKAYKCDVSDFERVKETTEKILADFKKVDILVNNAGITRDKLVMQMKEEDFDACINTNLKGAFNFIKHFSRSFLKQRSGRIINISSVVGLMGNVGQANYAASKAGIIGLTKSVAKEFASRGITCNAIAPGYIETDMTGALSEDMRAEFVKSIPLGRAGAPSDVAKAVLFLASDDASYITGQVLSVDGGMYI